MASTGSACRCSARSPVTRRSPCRSGISDSCRPARPRISDKRLDDLADRIETGRRSRPGRRHGAHHHGTLAGPCPALPPARPADRAGAGRAFSFVYPHILAGMARGRRRDRALLAPGGRGAAGGLRCLLAAGRLSGASCRAPRRCPPFPRRPARVRRETVRCMGNAAATWCSGESIEDGERRHAPDGGPAPGRHQLRPTQASSRLSDRDAADGRAPLGQGRRRLVGHEFHYASIISQEHRQFRRGHRRDGRVDSGSPAIATGSVTGTFFHVLAADSGGARRREEADDALVLPLAEMKLGVGRKLRPLAPDEPTVPKLEAVPALSRTVSPRSSRSSWQSCSLQHKSGYQE